MRRAGELSRLLRQLPAREDVLQIDYRQLSDRLAEIPDDVNGVLKLVDGRRTVADIIEDAPGDELAAAAILVRLCVEELVRRAVPAAPGGGGAPAPAPATPQPERVTWFTGPADEPRPDAGKPPVQRGDAHPE